MIRAKVELDYASFGVAVTIADVGEERALLFGVDEVGFIRPTSTTDKAVQPQPTFRIRDDAARVLLDALLDYFRGGSDTRQLRKDFEHEQKRVDDLLGTVTTLARRGVTS